MATVTRSYRIRAYPNGAQRRLLDRWLGATRWLWNTALEIRSEAHRVCRLKLTGNDLSRWVTQWKRTPGHEWLAEVPATALTQCLRDQDRAFTNFFARRTRYPRFTKFAGGRLRQLAGRDDRDLRVDARGACPDDVILAQVLAEEARSGHRNRACLEQARLS
jgi:putative transposase